jgi:site-specific recombinase XerD
LRKAVNCLLLILQLTLRWAYTVSKMLTHKNVTTTQIYADLVSQKKRDTVNKIRLK